MNSFAIVIICYNRLDGIKRLVKSLEKADYDNRKDITLIFSIDYSGNNDVFDFTNEYQWIHGEKVINRYSERQGLKKHILSCGDYTQKYDVVVILEDDIYVSDSFYKYAFQAAKYYENDDKIAGISLYAFQKNWLDWIVRFEPQKIGEYDTYFMKIAQSWGQVWTQKKWEPFKKWLADNPVFDDKQCDIPDYLLAWPKTSWLKWHDKYLIAADKYFVYPYYSFSTNFSDAGEHAIFSINDYQVELTYNKIIYQFPKFDENAVKYDQYMTREGLSKYLGIKEEELCVDFWSTKKNIDKKRYILTLNSLPYSIVKSFKLALRPIELNIICDLEGTDIFLYDTTIKERRRKKDFWFKRYNYSIRSRESHKVLKYAIHLRYRDIILRAKGKIKHIIRKLKKQ